MQHEPKHLDDLSAVWRRAEHQRTSDLIQWIVAIAAQRAAGARPVRSLFGSHWRTARKRLETAGGSVAPGGKMASS
jgi:hypothetical protein